MNPRRDYTIVLEITPTSPLTHGSGSEGNQQVLMTRECLLPSEHDPSGWERVEIPAVSGAAVKATFREHAVADFLERAGIEDGTVSRDALRLLLKGGKNDRGGQTVSLAESRRLRELAPLLSVFGSLDGGIPIRGRIQVSDAMVWCKEAVDAGVVPREVRALTVEVDGATTPTPKVEVFPGSSPPPLHMTRTQTTNYRHDMATSPLLPFMGAGDQIRLEDQKASNAEKKAAGERVPKASRREANESMPHSAQAIAPGTPMVCLVRLQGVTEVEFAAFGVALTRWITSGAHLGGGASKGHGACRVRLAGAIRSAEAIGASTPDGDIIQIGVDTEGSRKVVSDYDAYIQARKEDIRAWVRE